MNLWWPAGLFAFVIIGLKAGHLKVNLFPKRKSDVNLSVELKLSEDQRKTDGNHERRRAELIAWIRSVLAEKDWTCERWAREAGVHPVTLTRFIKQDRALISQSTLIKLVDAAKRPFAGIAPLPSGEMPMLVSRTELVHWREGKMEPLLKRKQFAIHIDQIGPGDHGVDVGDKIIVDRAQPIVNGDLAVFQLQNHDIYVCFYDDCAVCGEVVGLAIEHIRPLRRRQTADGASEVTGA